MNFWIHQEGLISVLYNHILEYFLSEINEEEPEIFKYQCSIEYSKRSWKILKNFVKSTLNGFENRIILKILRIEK